MIAERALLKEIMIYFAKGDITIRKFENSGDIAETLHEIQELLAQPEQEQEPLSEEVVGELLMDGFSTHLMDLVRMIEKAQGIGVDDE